MNEFPATIGPGIPLPNRMLQQLINWNSREVLSAWFTDLPPKLDAWCTEWEIELEAVDLPDTVSIVLFGHSQRVGDVVIKVGPPNYERNAEIAATAEAAGPGMVRVIAADPTVSLLMLERLVPGSQLAAAGLDDAEMTHIVASRLRAFWRPASESTGLVPLERWTRPLLQFSRRDEHGFPNDLVWKAQGVLEEMQASPTSQSLLHGDMHHHNILWAEGEGWTTIDPKGLIGERGFDVTAWMMNPWGFPTTSDFLPMANRRLDILARETGEDRSRLAQWCVVFAALNLCWSLSVDQPDDLASDIAILENMMQLHGA
jgi:streptomycin 6-kinase